MDGITTDEIADLLRDDVPVIVISGQHTTTIAITGSYVLLHKPFDFGRLADELKKVLPVFETE